MLSLYDVIYVYIFRADCPALDNQFVLIPTDKCSPHSSPRHFLFATDRPFQKTSTNQNAKFQSPIGPSGYICQTLVHPRLSEHWRRGA